MKGSKTFVETGPELCKFMTEDGLRLVISFPQLARIVNIF